MLTFIFVLIIIACLLLILLVLIQNPKGGIAANFIAPSQIMGVKRSTDVVEKATWGLAFALISLSLLTNFFRPDGSSTESVNESRIKDNIEQTTVPMAPQAPQAGQAANTQEKPAEQPAK